MGETIVVEAMAGRLELKNRWLYVDDKVYFLTPQERDVMRFFMQRPDEVHYPRDITNVVWGSDHHVANARVQIRNLRRKVEKNPGCQRIVHTCPHRTGGYILFTDPKLKKAFFEQASVREEVT